MTKKEDPVHHRWNRKANGHREQKSQLPTTLDGGHRDDGLWSMGLFWTAKTKFQFDPRTGQKIEFTPTPGGRDLTMKLEPPERANKIMNKAIQKQRQ